MLKLYTQVFIDGNGRPGTPMPQGRIVGTGTIVREDSIQQTYIVKLDHGFYAPGEKTYISHVVVDVEAVQEVRA